MWMIERQLRGATMDEVAQDLGISARTVSRELARAESLGLVEVTRNKLIDSLDGAANVYLDILAQTPETLHKFSRGYKLKKDTADALNAGLGVFKTESTKHVQNTLAVIASEVSDANPDEDKYGFPRRPRVQFQPETVDGEMVESE
jgi:predicted DNA-binding transcriptional regulator YafY